MMLLPGLPTVRRFPPLATPLVLAAAAFLTSGCTGSSESEVVVYAALDAEFSEPILNDFQQSQGIRVRPKFDVESTKTVGLVNALIQEQRRPRCDVFWNNEILHTLRLRRLGLLEPYPAEAARSFPEDYRAEDGTWHGLAARARVLIVNTELVPESERPGSIQDLVDPRWKDKVGIARPLFGTTATHAAVLFAEWGEETARDFFTRVKENAQVMSGNKQVALAVGRGQLAFGLTDTDDAIIEQDQGRPVAIVYPDQAADQPGTLFIPNTLCILRGSPNPAEARKLVEYLLSPDVERRLARGSSAQFPVNPEVDVTSRAAPETDIRWMEVDFEAAADQWDAAARFLRDTFEVAE